MTKSFSTTMTLLVALLVVAIPVALAIYLADRQAHKTELSLVTGYARDVLHRSETTSDQILSATNSLLETRADGDASGH